MTTAEEYKKGPLDAMYERGYVEAISKVFGICSKHIKRGKWLEREPKCLVCSQCGGLAPLNYFGQNCEETEFCPHCGSKQDKK